MSIDRDDCDERQARVDLMINEFREAQKRRYLNRNDKAVDSQLEATTKVPLDESTTPTITALRPVASRESCDHHNDTR